MLALKEFIACREQRRIADLMGTLEWDDSFDLTPAGCALLLP